MPHIQRLILARRPVDAPIAVPTGLNGVNDQGVTVGNAAATASSFQFDTAAATVTGTRSVPPIAPSFTPTITTTPSSTATPSVTQQPSVTAAADASKPIAISTVIGACVGAFIACILLIGTGVAVYRRSNSRLSERARARGPGARNVHRDGDHSKSRSDNWNKLEGGEDNDSWVGKYPQTKELGVGPMENLTMFKKSPSMRSGEKEGSDVHGAFDADAHPFAKYTPKLAEDLAGVPPARPFLGRVETGPPISWDGETINGDQSFLSLHNAPARSSGAMSPTPSNKAIPTPAITSAVHRWESAEVMHFAEDDPSSPFADPGISPEDESVLSARTGNPFFAAQDMTRSRSRSSSIRSRSNSVRSKSSVARGKQRAVDPFDDFSPINSTYPPPFSQHLSTPSVGSDRALAGLIAALGSAPEDARDRLRIESLQPSFISSSSIGDVAGEFPLPPHGGKTP